MNKYKTTFNCSSSTSKKEIFKFIKQHINKTIVIHYENNVYNRWGDDTEVEIKNTKRNFEKINRLINENYIHGIYIK